MWVQIAHSAIESRNMIGYLSVHIKISCRKHCPPPRIETAIQMVSHDRPMGNTDWDIQVTATLLSSGSCSHTGIVGDRSTAQPTRMLEVMYSTRDARPMTLKITCKLMFGKALITKARLGPVCVERGSTLACADF